MRAPVLLAVVAAAVAAGGAARADAEEHQVAVAARGSMLALHTADADATAPAAGGAVRLAYGVTDDWEAGAKLSLVAATGIEFANARVDEQDGNLFSDVFVGELAGEMRWLAGVDRSTLFERTRPLVAARLGLVARLLRDQALLDEDSELVLAPDDALTLRPFVGAEVGAQHRFGRALMLAVTLDGAYAGDAYRDLGLRVELGWAWY